MDITITTASPEEVNPDEIQELLEAAGYYVTSITVLSR